MSEHDEKWLRDGLASAVPEPPASPDRARAAEGLARRRRRTTTAVAAGVTAVVAIAGLTAALGTGPAPRQDRPNVDSPTAGTGQCPPIANNPRSEDFFDEPHPQLPGEVPHGARWVRVCAGNGNRIDVPEDALVGAVDQLADAVNSLPAPEEDLLCTQELGFGYRLVFGGYADRPNFVVSGALYGCGYVIVGSDRRTGAADLLRTFGDLLREERSTRAGGPPPIAPTSDLPCGRFFTPAVAGPEDLKTAVLCVETDDGYLRSDVPAGDLEILREDLGRNVGHNGWPDCSDEPHVSLVGVTAWNERLTLGSICSIGWFAVPQPWGTPGWGASWHPGDKAQAILQELLATARDPDEPSDESVSCPDDPLFDDAEVEGDERDLPDSVPEGATSARLCVERGSAPADVLTTRVDALVDTINDLPRQRHGACTDEGPVGYRLALGYPDGSRFVVAGLSSGCGYAVVGSSYRGDPDAPLDTFVRLLRSQRSSQQAPAGEDPPPSCRASAPYVGFDYDLAETDDIVAASVCVTDVRQGSIRGAEVPDADLGVLIADMADAEVDNRAPCSLSPARYSTSIVAVTAWGDVVDLPSDCHGFELPGSRQWLPSPGARSILDRLVSEARRAR